MKRVLAYEKVYETIEDYEDRSQISYIKLINVGEKVISRHCTGYLPSQVAFYLQNVHIHPRRIFLCINAEHEFSMGLVSKSPSMDSNDPFPSQDSVGGSPRIGADSVKLTAAGRAYALDLAKFMELEHDNLRNEGKEPDIIVLSGSHRANHESVLHLRTILPVFATPLLNELRAGNFQGMSRSEIKRVAPTEFERREKDKLRYRYPGVGGESYMDVVERVRPVIIELERQRRSVAVVCHTAVLRCIYAYFMGTPVSEMPFLQFNLGEIIELTPGPFGCEARRIRPSAEVRSG